MITVFAESAVPVDGVHWRCWYDSGSDEIGLEFWNTGREKKKSSAHIPVHIWRMILGGWQSSPGLGWGASYSRLTQQGEAYVVRFKRPASAGQADIRERIANVVSGEMEGALVRVTGPL